MHQTIKRLFYTCLVAGLSQAPAIAQSSGGVTFINRAGYSYDSVTSGTTNPISIVGDTGSVTISDPAGRVRDFRGELLTDYSGSTIGLYDAADPAGFDLGPVVALTPTGPGTVLPDGVTPNEANSNAYGLTNTDEGTYIFILDEGRGQLQSGRVYLLVFNPAPGSEYEQRRIRIVVGQRMGSEIPYTATSLDGQPIFTDTDLTEVSRVFHIVNGTPGATLALLNLNISVGKRSAVTITKTGDRASAAPGDHVVYRVVVRNSSDRPLDQVVVTDNLPRGFEFVRRSVRAQLDGDKVSPAVQEIGRTVTFSLEGQPLPPGSTLQLAYAVLLTPDALGGRGINAASVTGRSVGSANGAPSYQPVNAGPSLFRVRVERGILTDVGTLLGRVWVDTNADGEQQRGEPGVEGVVVWLDDGTRIITDRNGLFSLANVQPGYRVGAIDFRSIPGFTLARNRRFIERNGPSRLARLEPGGTARLNFGLAPLPEEEGSR